MVRKTSPVIENEPREINIPNLVALTARLAQVMAEEADMLDAMQISKLPTLHDEKQWLTKALEFQLKRIRKYPEMLDDIDHEQMEDLRAMVRVFEKIRQENYDRLLVAREINLRLVEAIKEVVQEHSMKAAYRMTGDMDYTADTLSVTLNEKV
jgi:ABC-type Zn uptake system ZnuABC Zn-binding protein ZnuA